MAALVTHYTGTGDMWLAVLFTDTFNWWASNQNSVAGLIGSVDTGTGMVVIRTLMLVYTGLASQTLVFNQGHKLAALFW